MVGAPVGHLAAGIVEDEAELVMTSLVPMFPTPMHPIVIRSDGAAAPNTEDGTMLGIANAAPAATADPRKNCRRLMR